MTAFTPGRSDEAPRLSEEAVMPWIRRVLAASPVKQAIAAFGPAKAAAWVRRAAHGAQQARRLTAGASRCCMQLLAGRLIEVPVAQICDEYAFSLADEGWHYFRSILAEHQRQPQLPAEQSTFWRFFHDERVRSARYLNDVLFLHDPARRERPGDFHFEFGTYPWGEWKRRYARVGGQPFGRRHDQMSGEWTRDRYGYRSNIWHGPGDPYALRKEWRHTIEVCESLRRGYLPVANGAIPQGVLLQRRDGDVRLVRFEGHHRLTALSHLGRERVRILLPRRTLQVVDERQVREWYYVKRGLCSEEQALEIFAAFFELNGRERIEYLGLPQTY